MLEGPVKRDRALERACLVTATIGLGLVACGATGVALALAIRSFRRGREVASVNSDLAALLVHDGDLGRELDALRDEVLELRAAVIDSQRRWGFDLSRWPRVKALVGEPSSSEVSWWLIQHAPGIGSLNHEGRPTDRFFPAHNGWRPPAQLAGQR